VRIKAYQRHKIVVILHRHTVVILGRYVRLYTAIFNPSFHHTMLQKSAFFRAVAIPVCLVWGVLELLALQRSRLRYRRD
jgi:hypothetical protein